MVNLLEIPNVYLDALAQIFATAGNSVAGSKYNNSAAFWYTLASALGSELDARRFMGAKTLGAIQLDPAVMAPLTQVERKAACDFLAEMSENLSDPAVSELLDLMVYEWFRDVETP